jgi:L-aspartate oxidase
MTESATTESATTESATTESATTESATTESAMTESAMTESAMTKRALTKRALTETGWLGHDAAEAAATGTGPGRCRWRRDADVVVVGSGAAGISVALTATARGLRVLMVTKDLVGGATPLAQGGLAAALGAGDSPAAHVSDTLTAGVGLCEPDVVTALAAGAPGTIDWLTGLGARLETRKLRLEGGHSAHRIVHSGDDATGAEVHRALLAALLASRVEILDRTVALDLIPGDEDVVVGGRRAEMSCSSAPAGADGAGTGTGAGASAMAGTAAANAGPAGALVREPVPARSVEGLAAARIGADGRLTQGVVSARAVVIAAGGLGQAFGTTSNPAGATGDGIAIAARAGAVLRDLEFVQFHPTVLWLPEASGQCPLITEALRGAGAVLRDADGTPLMAGHDPRGDLAPRDVVAARMAEVIAAGGRSSSGAGHVWLDATGLGRELLEGGFPTVTAACRKHGIDPVTEYIPVTPGAHYSCGGILADLDGRTTLAGLYAVGEAASTGVQGANRLASNSVTEAIIAGRRAGEAIAAALASVRAGAVTWAVAGPVPVPVPASMALPVTAAALPVTLPLTPAPVAGASEPVRGNAEAGGVGRAALAQAMSRYAGVIRDADGLARLLRAIAGADAAAGAAGRDRLVMGGAVREEQAPVLDPADLETVEAANLRTVSLLIAAGALRRAESRGCHRRRDAAATGDTPWHTLLRWDGRQLLVTEEKM